MSEHLIKETDDETIIRYELANKSIWVVRKQLDERTGGWGVADTKKRAEKDAIEALTRKAYAYWGTPTFISQLGSTNKYNNRPEVNSVPASVKFLRDLLPYDWQSKYIFRVIVDQNSPRTFVEIAFQGKPDMAPLRYYSDDKKGHHQQLTNCIYQFYVDKMRHLPTKGQHIKLAEWQANWYNKLQPRRAT